MLISEFKKTARALKEAYAELEQQAISEGISILSPEYTELQNKVRLAILSKLGFTLQEYRDAKEKATGKESVAQIAEEMESKVKFLETRYIPTGKDIEAIAEKVAKKYIVPPQITNQIVEKIIKEKPIKETVIQREEYNDNPIRAELGYLDDRINKIPVLDTEGFKEELRSEFQKNLKHNIDTLGMPDFRKLAMGLRADIDRISNTSSGGGHTIEDEGTPLTQRTTMNFTGAGVAVTDVGGKTVVTINGGGGTIDGSGTLNELTYWVDSDTLGSLAVATYPSLTELSYVKGVTSAIQTQLGNKLASTFTKAQLDTAVTDGNVMYIGDAPTAHTHALAAGATDVTSSAAELNILDGATLSTTELNYVDGVTSAIQTQLDAKLALAGGTMSGNITLGENTAIALDPAGSADGKYSGITVTGVAGYAQAFGDLVYLSSVDSRWELADADAAGTADRMLAMVVVAGGSDGAACTLLLQGIIRADAKFPALTIGSAVYVGETAGAIQVAIPTGADNVIRRVGYAMTADEIYFSPSQDSQITVA